jgi:hypothetical protein
MTNTMIAAAVGGILLGLNGCAESTPPAAAPADTTASSADGGAAKHACKGQNECRSQGGCKTDTHACKGQNDCRSQGGCKTAGVEPLPPR